MTQLIVSLLTLSRADMKCLRITDPYSIHRVVYDLFEDVRTSEEKKASVPSGLLYVDKGGDANKREILILSNRPPRSPSVGSIHSKSIPETFLSHTHYQFEVVINPTKRDNKTGRLIAIRERDSISRWFVDKAPSSWGFSVDPKTISVEEVQVQQFHKSQDTITQSKTRVKGFLTVLDQQKFINSFKQGIGRGRAFGLGLLQIVPFNTIR